MKNKIEHIRLNDPANGYRTIVADFTNGQRYEISLHDNEVRYGRLTPGMGRAPRKALAALYDAFWLFFYDEQPGGIDYGSLVALDALVPFVDWTGYGRGTRQEKAAVLENCLANFENF